MEAAENLTNQFLTFSLGDDVFAVDVVMAREVLDFETITRVPQTPDDMLGVINLRGAVVPVIDMRSRFGMKAAEMTSDSCIIVVEVDVDGAPYTVGALVDAVQEVIDINESQIEPPPRIGIKHNTDFIRGMGNLGEKFVIIIDINRVFSVYEPDLLATETWTVEE